MRSNVNIMHVHLEIFKKLKKKGTVTFAKESILFVKQFREIKLEIKNNQLNENEIETIKHFSVEQKLVSKRLPRVSIIIPCYGQAHFLDYALKSVAKATSLCHEVIVVDDHAESRLELFELKKIKAHGPHQILKIVRLKKNSGLSSARNTGVLIATSPYVKFLDADDLLMEGSLDYEIQELEDKKVMLTISSYQVYFQNSGEIISKHPFEYSFKNKKLNEFPSPSTISSLWERGITIPIHSALMRKELIPKFNTKLLNKEDFNFWLRVANANPTFLYLEKPAVWYRRHQIQTTNDRSNKAGFYFIEALYETAKSVELGKKNLRSAILYANLYYGMGSSLLFSIFSKDRKRWIRSVIN
jgi:glycosyltransferase involved in cell wall biosynthesis